MTHVLRTLCMILVFLALPIQGFAQVSMYACHMKGGQADSMVQMSHADMGHAGMDAATMDHSMHMNMADDDSSAKVAKFLHGCCNCAATCAMVLPPLQRTVFSNVQPDRLEPVYSSQPAVSTDLRRIDRPPKQLAI